MNSEIRITSNIFLELILISEITNSEIRNTLTLRYFCHAGRLPGSHFEKPLLSSHVFAGAMPPQSSTDYDLQLQNTVRELQDLQEDILCDAFFLFSEKNVPSNGSNRQIVDPKRIKEDLEQKHSFNW